MQLLLSIELHEMVQFLLNSTNSPATQIPSPTSHLHHTPPTHSPDAQGHTPSTR
jgi:hypothetical protein